MLFCKSDDEPYYGFIAFIPEILTLLSANVMVMYMGNSLPQMQLDFLSGIRLEYGFFRFLFLGLIVFVYIYYVLSDMLSSDVFISMMSANIVAAILSVDLTGITRTIILILSIVFGYGLRVAKRFVITNILGGDDDSSSVLLVPLLGLIATVILGLLFLVIYKIMGY